eukprot:CAMPEP_0117034594 /NCGR_PEP_ID=MMETSP0472-20121206/24618_1 /TAXON_ID=693140 ORGANISM="Tiarina fusus, Strain LIS" /NCGR_SAMPLE_ID=MMETSP0472 /ASSEMBLY_ACC=CAM_ASM_000603 /LENGTH=196 /DNA_ID=CAMNT_0004743807 /DNA_START=133 /DNA_END=723 /DNA_ORIENTATION=+
MILYYASEEPNEELEESLKNLSEISATGFVNCARNEDPCLDHNVSKKRVPAVSVNFNKNKRVFFSGDVSDMSAVHEWAHEIILGKTVLINTLEATEQLKEGNWIIKFFAPWCGHCKTLAPIWTKVSVKVDSSVRVAKVDCDRAELKAFCSDNDVSGFPTLQAWKDGSNISSFDKDRTEGPILSWAKEVFSSDHDEL